MELTQQEILKLQNTTEETNTSKPNSTELVSKEHVEGTGFDLVGNEEQGYFVALGMYRITKAQSKEECKRMINEKDYELLLGLIGAVIQSQDKDTQERLKTLMKDVDRETNKKVFEQKEKDRKEDWDKNIVKK